MTRAASDVRQLVLDRAGHCCEYCHVPTAYHPLPFHVDPIKSIKHAGTDNLQHLCLICPLCALNKGSDVGSLDSVTGEFVFLFDPRLEMWDDHFRLNNATIEPLTARGRVTVRLLRMNDSDQLDLRAGLLRESRYPCIPAGPENVAE